MKLLIPAPKKRNPPVPAALQRLAGPHRPSRKRARQDAAADLRSRLVEKTVVNGPDTGGHSSLILE